jgi:hypothetical protein
MPCTPAPVGSVISLADRVTLAFKDCLGKPHRKTYRIGDEREPKDRSEGLKPDSVWAKILLGKKRGAFVTLPLPELNTLEAEIILICR